jgi:hypothetical protein
LQVGGPPGIGRTAHPNMIYLLRLPSLRCFFRSFSENETSFDFDVQ